MKQKTVIFIALFIAALAFYIFVIKNGKTNKIDKNGQNRRRLNLSEGEFPLKLGSTCVEVLYLQAYMNKEKGANLVLDGIWGPQTEAAFKAIEWENMNQNFGSEMNGWHYSITIKGMQENLKQYINQQGIDF